MNKNRILAFKNKPPKMIEAIPSEFTLATHYLKPVKPRQCIPQTSERTLYAPEILDDFYLNLLDWVLGDTVYLWDASSKSTMELLMVDEESGLVTSVKWDPDGRRITVGLNNSDVQLWDSPSKKMVRFDNLEPESVRFMAREILILRRLDHPNVVKLQGLATSRMSCSLYLVFDYMVHDLADLASSPRIKFTEPQVKCYMHQLLSGLEHCHNQNVLHRDIKGPNLLIDDQGVLKIADFGLALTNDPNNRQPMTSRVGIDLLSAGCILAELFAGKPIMTGRTEQWRQCCRALSHGSKNINRAK